MTEPARSWRACSNYYPNQGSRAPEPRQLLPGSIYGPFPAGSPSLAARRALFLVLVMATIASMLWPMSEALSARSLGVLYVVILFLFATTLPWIAIGFWNSLIGFALLRSARSYAEAVTPAAGEIEGNEPVSASAAILMCIRNELPHRVIRNLDLMMADLVSEGHGDRFHVYVLSDTSLLDIAELEQVQLGALAKRWRGRLPLTYRRRALNTGFKAGNIRDFCDRWGGRHELAVILDGDSLMPASAILRLVRITQADPKLGILQSRVVARPSTSAFARLFQFGMRMSMRAYTIGAAWWQGDCVPIGVTTRLSVLRRSSRIVVCLRCRKDRSVVPS
jgi:membrane glycosyltransferase